MKRAALALVVQNINFLLVITVFYSNIHCSRGMNPGANEVMGNSTPVTISEQFCNKQFQGQCFLIGLSIITIGAQLISLNVPSRLQINS